MTNYSYEAVLYDDEKSDDLRVEVIAENHSEATDLLKKYIKFNEFNCDFLFVGNRNITSRKKGVFKY